VAIDGVSLEIAQGELLALLGPSGSGKTTLLRIIAGLEQADSGSLSIQGRDALQMPARQRGTGFVFQNYALFRHMTAADNIGFGLSVRPRAQRPSRAAIAARVADMLELVQLDGLGHRFPSELSGGQQQRVALARALAVEPKLLLLDEPFGALDAKVRVELRNWLRRLHDKLGLTTIFVTHDQEEALELADRVAILNAGRIEQVDRSRDVYERPASRFVVEFLGEVNKLPCRIVGGVATLGPRGGRIDCRGLPEGPAIAYVRPHEIRLDPTRSAGSSEAIVRSLSMIGPRTRLNLDLGGIALAADIDRSVVEPLALAPGRPIFVQFTMVRLFPDMPSGASHRRDSGRDDPQAASRDLPLKRQMHAVQA
jgi:sulfate transport system ATP-binding protein